MKTVLYKDIIHISQSFKRGSALERRLFVFFVSFNNKLEVVVKVIIAGGREFNNYALLKEKCTKLFVNKMQDIEIVSGLAKGADTLGVRLSEDLGCSLKKFPANWKKFGRRAGFLRNEQMGEYADALVAFWNGKSSGTRHMIKFARRIGLDVRVVRY